MVSKIKYINKWIVGLIIMGTAILLWPKGQVFVYQSPHKADPRSILRMQLQYEPVTLDFSLAEDGVSFRILSALMTGLVSYDRDYKLKMQIAEKFERLDGGRKYRFTLRPWKWSDGEPVKAADFLYAFQRTLNPKTPSKLADLLFFVKGARAYKQGSLKDFSKVGIQAPKDNILEFTLTEPISFFAHILTLPIGYPQRSDQIEKLGAQWSEHMVTTGPYKLVRWRHDQSIQIDRNPNYPFFDEKAPRRALFQIISEEATAVNLFENNRVDVLFRVPSFDIERFRKKGVVREFPYFVTYYVAFNQRHAPWNDRRARLAVAQAIHREAVVTALGSTESVAMSWIPRGLPGYNPSIGVAYQPEQAKLNWNQVRGQISNTALLGFDSSYRNQTVVERIQADLKQNLGLSLQAKNRDWKAYLNELATNPPPIYRFGWLSPFVDAYPNLAVFHSESLNNYTGWKSKEYDRLLHKIATLDADQPERRKLIDKAQRLLLEEAVVLVPIFHYVQGTIVAPHVKNFWVNGLGLVDYMNIRLE